MSLYAAVNRATPNDITRLVKQHFVVNPDSRYNSEKVVCRTSRQLLYHRPNGLWKQNFVRRQRNFEKGFYSTSNQPYLPIGGDVILETKDLVLRTLAKSLDDKVWIGRTHDESRQDKPLPPIGQFSRSASPTKASSSECFYNESCITAGYSNIVKEVNESLERLTAVRAGQSYEDHVTACQTQKSLLQDENNLIPEPGMTLMSLTSLLQLSAPYSGIPIGDMKPKRSLVDVDMESAASDLDDSLRDSDSEDDYDGYRVPGAFSNRKARQRRDHIKFLEATFAILLSMNSMKTRDLRSKVPLSLDALKALRKERQQPDRESRLTTGPNMSRNARMSTETLISMADATSVGQQWDRQSVLLSSINRRGTTTHQSGQFNQANGVFSMRRRSRHPSQCVDRERAVETWDDLVALEDKDYGNEANPLDHHIIFKTLRWSRKASSEPAPLSTPVEKIPIWQTVANEKTRKIYKRKKKQHIDPEQLLQRTKKDLLTLKHSLEQENDAELQKLEREKLVAFKFKFSVFEDLSPIVEEHKMRMSAAMRVINKNLDVLDVQPSKWYEELKMKSYAVCGKDSLEFIHILNKISRFSQMNPKTLMHAKAKLCLLVMSLPAYELCDIDMQKAIKFVLESILLGASEQFQHWMVLRKLPIVIMK